MKYCPTCQSLFDGDEAFCPHDGTRLIPEGAYQPGRLAGSSLAGLVNLEAFVFEDHLGERYRGRLLTDNREVQVLVFHRRYRDRREKANQILAGPGPLPPQILETHSFQGDGEPLFLIEERAQRESLAHLLKKKGPLPWNQAVHLAIKLARVLDWLAEHQIPHRSLHPSSIFLDNPAVNSIQVGELAAGLITFPLPKLDANTPFRSLPIYPGFLAPECVLTPEDVDLQKVAAFSIGALLLEALGAPLLPHPIKELNLHEWLARADVDLKGLQLQDDAPGALPDLIRMLASPRTETRFQSAKAAMAALSSLVDGELDDIAPPLEPRKDSAFPKKPRPVTQPVALPDAQDDGARNPSPHEAGGTLVTHIGLPAQAMQENSDGDQGGRAADSPRVITESHDDGEAPHYGDTLQLKASDLAAEISKDIQKEKIEEKKREESQSEEISSRESDGEIDVSGKTLMLGSADFQKAREEARQLAEKETPSDASSDSEEQEAHNTDEEEAEELQRPAAENAKDEEIYEPEKTRQLHAVDAAAAIASVRAEREESSEDAPEGEDPKESESSRENTESPAEEKVLVSGESVIAEKEKKEEGEPSIIVNSHEGDGPKIIVDEPEDEQSAPQDNPTEEADPSDEELAKTEVDENLGSDDPAEGAAKSDALQEEGNQESRGESRAEEEKKSSPAARGIEIGFVEAKNKGGDEFVDDWFSRSNQDAWEESIVQEAYERSRWAERATQIGFIIGGIVLIVVVVLFTVFYEPKEEEDPRAEVVPEAVAVDVEALKTQFDEALARGAILEPRRESALHALRELRRHAEEDTYDQARQRFVDATDAAGRRAEEEGNLFAARNFSGYASEFEPSDEELRERAQAIQARFLAMQEGNPMEEDLPQGEADESSEESEEEEEENGTVEAPSQRSPSTSPSAPSTPRQTETARPRPTASAGELFRQAQAAEQARNYEEARTFYLDLLQVSPNHTQGNANLARIYFDVDSDHRTAIRYQRRAVESAPTNVNHRVQLGRLHFRLAEYEEAIRIWEQVLEIDPNNSEAERWIGLARRSMN